MKRVADLEKTEAEIVKDQSSALTSQQSLALAVPASRKMSRQQGATHENS